MNTTQEVLEQLERPVDVGKLIKKLTFDLDNFEQANLEQPRLSLEAGRYFTWAVLEKAKAEFRLELEEANLGSSIRSDGAKRTEKSIADSIVLSPSIREKKKLLRLAKASEVYAKQLLEAFQQRLQVLNNITKLRASETATELRAMKEKAAVEEMSRKADRIRR